MQRRRFGRSFMLLGVLVLLSSFSPLTRGQIPYRVGDIVTTNFGMQNRLRWTNDYGQIYTPSNTTIRLQDFAGKIVFFMFFDVW